jgi:hypothetical protein
MMANAPADRMYGLAVRDEQLYLILRIRRNAHGEIFYMFPRAGEKAWDPHGSYHRDGRYHHKSFDHKMTFKQGPKPDANFIGTINFVATSIESGDPQTINVACQAEDFSQVLEIPIAEISEDRDIQTSITIDISEPGGKPNIVPGSRIIQSWALRDVVPWILVTVSASRKGFG